MNYACFLLAVLLLVTVARADCECGYRLSTNNTATNTSFTNVDPQSNTQLILTDLIETNFANISDVGDNTDWVRQEWTTTPEQSRGDFGTSMAVSNVVTNNGGLDITVRAGEENSMVAGGEIDTARRDVFYGTFRASMKLTDVSGTVGAFFWVSLDDLLRMSSLDRVVGLPFTNMRTTQYFNDTQEIDIEFLSKDFNTTNSSYPINMVLQSRLSAESGFDATNTPTYQVAYLPFDPRADFHEYRLDFVPGRVIFLADGAVLTEMDDPSAVPTAAGHLALSHWSNGNALWSGGPPTSDAVLAIQYVKAYFNSSDTARQQDFEARCVDPAAAGAVCDIPNVVAGNDSAAGWFFTGQKNMTANQTVSSDSGIDGGDSSGSVMVAAGGWLVMSFSAVVAGLILVL